ncbi:hypothetical protein [Dyella koreensis]|uniref:TniQ protein n=1 Tax=Dyella koreensis TaxID=311235 RepID=A0ABW8K8X1_9GAMM
MNALLNLQPAGKYLPQRLLGEDWTAYEGCSRFGVSWRASRLNHLTKNELRSALGVSLRVHENPFEKLTHTQASPSKLLELSPDQTIDTKHWPMEFWWPFGGPIPWEAMPWRLRICPACARHCYHSMLFQAPGVHHCPWHRVALIESCPRCDRPLLAGTREGLPIGACPCGHDMVDYVETIEGDSATLKKKQDAIEGYGIWAACSRRVSYLVPPTQYDARAWHALHGLAVPAPNALLPGQHGLPNMLASDLILERVSMERAIRHNMRQLSPKSGLESPKPSVVALPSSWKDPLTHIGAELTRMLPPSALKRLSSDPNSRSAMRHLSIFAGINGLYLHTESLEPTTLHMLSSLASALQADRHKAKEDTLSTRAKAHPLAPPVIHRTILRVLSRGYADGARVTLGRHAPELYDNARTRPKTRLPWVVICLPPKLLPSARIAWTPQPGTV